MKKILTLLFLLTNLVFAGVNENLFIAIEKNDISGVKLALKNGAKLNMNDKHGQSPLLLSLKDSKLDIVKYLVENGADVNAKSFNKHARGTALIYASSNNRVEVMNYLLDHGANINETTDPMEESSLFWTVAKGYVEGTELLLKRGIMENLKNKKGETALDIGRKLNRTQLVNLIEQYKK